MDSKNQKKNSSSTLNFRESISLILNKIVELDFCTTSFYKGHIFFWPTMSTIIEPIPMALHILVSSKIAFDAEIAS